MASSLSQDLRSRVIAAVDGGVSRRAAAERFGVSVSSAIRWLHAWRAEGRAAALPRGGDLRSQRVEAHRDAILGAVEAQPDITLVELAAMLEQGHGARFAPSTVHRFLARHRITFKERRRTPANRRGQTWPGGGRPGSTPSPSSTPSA